MPCFPATIRRPMLMTEVSFISRVALKIVSCRMRLHLPCGIAGGSLHGIQYPVYTQDGIVQQSLGAMHRLIPYKSIRESEKHVEGHDKQQCRKPDDIHTQPCGKRIPYPV